MPTPDKLTIVVIDDDREMRESLVHLLDRAGWTVSALKSAVDAEVTIAKADADVVLSDVRMPDRSGLELLEGLQGSDAPPLVLISAHGDIPMAVDAIQNGAYSFLEKPFDPTRLLQILRNAAERHRLTRRTKVLEQRLTDLSGLDRVLLGDTQAIVDLREAILDYAQTDARILILGETGTGKEVVANAIHTLSSRSQADFIAVNCAAIPVDRFEEIVFGKEGGADGLFIKANGGTLFLDEFAAAPKEAQAKFLRVLETNEIWPIGAYEPITIDARIVSATNETPEVAIAEGGLRGDLFHRLNSIVLTLPKLSERKDDIPLLFKHFVTGFSHVYEIEAPDLSAEDIAALLSHDWPGNVRELRNAAERFLLAARRGDASVVNALKPQELSEEVPETLREAVAVFERSLIAQSLKAHRGQMDAVAEALGIGRRTLNEKIVKLGLDKTKIL